jgi:hypothetical protein
MARWRACVQAAGFEPLQDSAPAFSDSEDDGTAQPLVYFDATMHCLGEENNNPLLVQLQLFFEHTHDAAAPLFFCAPGFPEGGNGERMRGPTLRAGPPRMSFPPFGSAAIPEGDLQQPVAVRSAGVAAQLDLQVIKRCSGRAKLRDVMEQLHWVPSS